MFNQHGNRATRIFRAASMTLAFALSGLLMQSTASAQPPSGPQIFVPPVLMVKPAQLSAPEKLKLLKSMPTVTPTSKSKTVWEPVLKLTPQHSYTSAAYWYFSQPAVFTPHWWEDEGAAIYVTVATTPQMIMRFGGGQANQAYAIDVTLGIGGNPGSNTFSVGYVVDGVAVDPQSITVGNGPYEHLLLELPPSKSGQYIVVVHCTQLTSWWYFSSLEVAMLQ